MNLIDIQWESLHKRCINFLSLSLFTKCVSVWSKMRKKNSRASSKQSCCYFFFGLNELSSLSLTLYKSKRNENCILFCFLNHTTMTTTMKTMKRVETLLKFIANASANWTVYLSNFIVSQNTKNNSLDNTIRTYQCWCSWWCKIVVTSWSNDDEWKKNESKNFIKSSFSKK